MQCGESEYHKALESALADMLLGGTGFLRIEAISPDDVRAWSASESVRASEARDRAWIEREIGDVPYRDAWRREDAIPESD